LLLAMVCLVVRHALLAVRAAVELVVRFRSPAVPALALRAALWRWRLRTAALRVAADPSFWPLVMLRLATLVLSA
jgi:hypothetical protein